MSQTLNTVPAFDGTNYGYWKSRMLFFLKSIDCWSIVETSWTKPADTARVGNSGSRVGFGSTRLTRLYKRVNPNPIINRVVTRDPNTTRQTRLKKRVTRLPDTTRHDPTRQQFNYFHMFQPSNFFFLTFNFFLIGL
jgi:hypothetical protein